MKDGIVQQIGNPQDVYDHPDNMFVAGFIGSPAMNFLDVTVTDKMTLKHKYFELETFDNAKKAIKENNLVGKDVVLGIRPEDLEDIAFVPGAKPSNTITATVEVTEPMGAEIYAYIGIEGTLMTARVNPRSQVKDGESFSLHVDLEKIHLFSKEDEKAYT